MMVLRYAHAQDDAVDRVLEKVEKGTLLRPRSTSEGEQDPRFLTRLHRNYTSAGGRRNYPLTPTTLKPLKTLVPLA